MQSDASAAGLAASLDLAMMGAAVVSTALTGLLVKQVRQRANSSLAQRSVFEDQRFVDLQVVHQIHRFSLDCAVPSSVS